MPLTLGYTVQEYARCMSSKELKALLVERDLPHSGSKAKMSARLTEWDDQHPFPLMQLPMTLRQKIYQEVSILKVNRGGGARIVKASDQSVEVAPPNLFRASSQVRTEGLSIFYRHHAFSFCLRDQGPWEISLKAIHEWLQRLDPGARSNIRQIEIFGSFLPCQIGLMDLIPSELSAEATVFYTSWAPAHYKTTELLEIESQYQLEHFPIYYVSPGLPECKKPTFLPGMDWFGQAVATTDVSANVQEEGKSKDDTTDVQEELSKLASGKTTGKKKYFYQESFPKEILEDL